MKEVSISTFAGSFTDISLKLARNCILTAATTMTYPAEIPLVPVTGSIRQVTFSSTGSSSMQTNANLPLEHVIEARYINPGRIDVRFADGYRHLLASRLLGMPKGRIDWPTLRVSPDCTTVIVNGIKGDPVPIDSTVLRYLADAKYAAELDAKLKSLQFTDEELSTMVGENQPPEEWFDKREPDLRRESWK